MLSSKSTLCALNLTDGTLDNQQMVDDPNKEAFRRRLAAALTKNGYDNASFAAVWGPKGQQKVSAWKKRGKIGQESVAEVRELLRCTNMEWLQEGIGEPERVTVTYDAPPRNEGRQSYSTRLPPAILAQAVRVMDAEEHLNGKNPPLKHAILLLQYCDRVAAGESVADLIAELTEG
jgi:hypothetical protein